MRTLIFGAVASVALFACSSSPKTAPKAGEAKACSCGPHDHDASSPHHDACKCGSCGAKDIAPTVPTIAPQPQTQG